jgi:hypothetical protein
MNQSPTAPNLTQPETNLLNKLQTKYGIVINPNDNTKVKLYNRFTGVSVETSMLVAALYRFTIEAISNYEMSGDGKMFFNGKPVAIGVYDRVKYLILKLDRKAYAELVD